MRGETSFDGYISATDDGRGMFNFNGYRHRPRKSKRPKRLCDRCKFLYGEDYENCDCKDLISGYLTSS